MEALLIYTTISACDFVIELTKISIQAPLRSHTCSLSLFHSPCTNTSRGQVFNVHSIQQKILLSLFKIFQIKNLVFLILKYKQGTKFHHKLIDYFKTSAF